MKKQDVEDRAVLVLANEAERMRNCAERVALVVRAMALRRGIATERRVEAAD